VGVAPNDDRASSLVSLLLLLLVRLVLVLVIVPHLQNVIYTL